MTKPDVQGAIDLQGDEESNLTIMERFEVLCQEMWANAVYIMDRQRKTGKRRSDAETDFQEDGMKQLKYMEKIITMLMKQGVIAKKPSEKFDEQLLARVVKMRSHVGDIVVTVPIIKEGG